MASTNVKHNVSIEWKGLIFPQITIAAPSREEDKSMKQKEEKIDKSYKAKLQCIKGNHFSEIHNAFFLFPFFFLVLSLSQGFVDTVRTSQEWLSKTKKNECEEEKNYLEFLASFRYISARCAYTSRWLLAKMRKKCLFHRNNWILFSVRHTNNVPFIFMK